MRLLLAGALVALVLDTTIGTSVAHAQTKLVSTSSAPTVAAPTEAQYDATTPMGVSTTWSVVASCSNTSGSCPVTLALGSTVLDVDWEFTTDPTGNCGSTPSKLNFQPLTTTPITIAIIQANKDCTMTFAFRPKLTAPASWSSYNSPTTYTQPVILKIVKP